MAEELAWRVFALPDVEERPSAISVPGARALWLWDKLPAGPREASMIGRESAHIHPMPDGSLHAALPPEVAQKAISKGWAEQHPVACLGYIPQNVVMTYAPRDAQEVVRLQASESELLARVRKREVGSGESYHARRASEQARSMVRENEAEGTIVVQTRGRPVVGIVQEIPAKCDRLV